MSHPHDTASSAADEMPAGTPSPSSQPPVRYRGVFGAGAYGGMMLAISLATSLAAGVAIGALTGDRNAGALVFLRTLAFGSSASIAAFLSRLIAGGESNGLLSTKLVAGDAGGILGLLAGLAIAGSQADTRALWGTDRPAVQIGDVLEISGPQLHGGEWKLSDQQGKVVLVDFWATWCQPCIAELPTVRRTHETLHAEGLEVVGVSLDFNREALQQFVSQHPEPWPQIFFEPTQENPLTKKYRVDTIPFLVIVGRDGKVAAVDVRGGQIEAAARAALAGKTFASDPFGGAGVPRILTWITAALLLSPWPLLMGGIVGCSIVGAMLERTWRRRRS